MSRSNGESERFSRLMRENLGRTRRSRVTGGAVRRAAVATVRGAWTAGRGAGNLAREAVEGAMKAVGEVSGESSAFVRDAVIGTLEGASQVVTVTTPAVREVVVGAIRSSGKSASNVADVGKDAVEGAIVGAASVGVESADAVSAAVDGSIDAVEEAGGDLGYAATATVKGVVSGVTATGGDVGDATRGAARRLVSHAGRAKRDASEIANVAERAVEAAFDEAEEQAERADEVITAVATGAVEAAYGVGRKQGDIVRRSVMSRILAPGRTLVPEVERQLSGIAEHLAEELPRGKATWRAAAMYRAVRVLLNAGGTDLAASLAYFTVLSFFPLIALVIMVFAFFSNPADIQDGLTETLIYYFPASSGLVTQAVDNLFDASIAVSVIAVAGIVIGANGLFLATNRSVNRIFEIETRKVVRTTAVQVLITTIVVTLFLLSVGLTAGLQTAINFGGGIAGSIEGASMIILIVSGIVSAILPPALSVMVFTVVYYHLPNTVVSWRNAAFGGIVAVILFELGKHLFFLFINQATQRSVVYGPVASVVVLLMWAYVAGLIFLFGAALVRAAQELRPEIGEV